MRTRPLRLSALVARAAGLGVLLVLAGCASITDPFGVGAVRMAPPSPAAASLADLPPPADEIVVAVYRFRDQTGQYKPTEGASSFSTAVTQGATSILVKALQDSKWFTPIEREALSNLLNERQIIQTTRSNYSEGETGLSLPPLLFAGMLIEGGIIGYDSNVLTGGAGARTLGVDASGQYRQDQVTVYIRAVSTQSGKVLKTVHTTKTILSRKVNTGLFRFVAADQLLEAEAGYTYNEPAVVAVTEAIETAVRALVLEGIRDGLWTSSAPSAESIAAVAAYEAELAAAARTDVYGRTVRPHDRTLSVSAAAGAEQYEGDFADPLVKPTAAVGLQLALRPAIAVGASAGLGYAAARDRFEKAYVATDVYGVYAPFPRAAITPTATLGAGVLALVGSGRSSDTVFPYGLAGLGAEAALTDRATLSLGLVGRYTLVEGLDGVDAGTRNDNLWSLRTGLRYSL